MTRSQAVSDRIVDLTPSISIRSHFSEFSEKMLPLSLLPSSIPQSRHDLPFRFLHCNALVDMMACTRLTRLLHP